MNSTEYRAPPDLIDSLDAILWELSLETWAFTYVSAGAERILGYPRATWIGDPDFWPGCILEADRDTAVSFCRHSTAAGADHDFQYRMVAADGRIVWIRDKVHVVKDAAGTPVELHGVMFDITAQKGLEERLRSSEDRFASFAEVSVDGILIHADGVVIDSNMAAERLLGYEPGGMVGVSAMELTIPEDRPRLAEHIRSGRETPLRGMGLTRDGRHVPVEIRGRSMQYRGTQARVVIVRDLTDRVVAEQAIRASEERLRLTLQQVPALVWTVDRSMTLTSAVGAALETFAAGADRAVGQPLVESLRGLPNARQILDLHAEALAGRPGSYFWEWGGSRIEANLEPMRDVQGTIIGAIGVGLDVSEARRVANALAETETRYRQLVETMPDGVAVHVSGAITFVNAVGAHIFGFSQPRGLLGRSLMDFVHPDHRVEMSAVLQALEATGRPVETHATVIRRPDGTTAHLELSATTLDYGGAQAMQFIYRDVTERERTREALREAGDQLRQSQKLEAVGRLAGGIAHDFNNLLTVITAFSQMVLDSLPDTDPRHDDLRQVRQAADRAADLTRQLLAFSRKQVMHPAVIDLNTVVREVDRMLRRVIGADVSIHTDLAMEGAPIHADRGQVEQVLMNLAVNARDAMAPDGGVLEIRTEIVELTRAQGAQLVPPAPPGRYTVLAVRDTGHGMSADVMRHIFDPFYTTKDVGAGTGLGLSMVYGIVQHSHGAVQVISSPGAGATFRLHFPHVQPPRSATPDGTVSDTTASGSETVLLVEDEDGVRAAAQRVLESRGFRVYPARNGTDALRVLVDDPFAIDLLLTDLVMPEMGGRELSVRAQELNPGLKVLYMTGYSADEVMRRGRESGMEMEDASIITKPFTMASLPERVRAALDG